MQKTTIKIAKCPSILSTKCERATIEHFIEVVLVLSVFVTPVCRILFSQFVIQKTLEFVHPLLIKMNVMITRIVRSREEVEMSVGFAVLEEEMSNVQRADERVQRAKTHDRMVCRSKVEKVRLVDVFRTKIEFLRSNWNSEDGDVSVKGRVKKFDQNIQTGFEVSQPFGQVGMIFS